MAGKGTVGLAERLGRLEKLSWYLVTSLDSPLLPSVVCLLRTPWFGIVYLRRQRQLQFIGRAACSPHRPKDSYLSSTS